MEFITYKGERIPIRVSYYAIKHFTAETGKDIEDLDDDITLMEVLFWYAMEAGYKSEGTENPFKRENIEIVLDSVLPQFIEVFGNFFGGLGATTSPQEKASPKKGTPKKTKTGK